jgi:hypothetical protein
VSFELLVPREVASTIAWNSKIWRDFAAYYSQISRQKFSASNVEIKLSMFEEPARLSRR